MSYPSQPGYPTPQYGPPQSPQQNNLWMIGGAILVVLVIIMTVILLVVQQTAGNDSADGGEEGTTGDDSSGEASSDTDGGDDGGDDGGGGALEITGEACDDYDMTLFEEAYGTYIPEDLSVSESSRDGLSSLTCTFYNSDATSVSVYVTDYDDASYVVDSVESDAEYYTEDSGYEYSEYTEIGDAGSLYTSTTSGSKTINIHVALGSLDVRIYATLWEGEDVDEAAAIAAMEDFIKQSETFFVDYM